MNAKELATKMNAEAFASNLVTTAQQVFSRAQIGINPHEIRIDEEHDTGDSSIAVEFGGDFFVYVDTVEVACGILHRTQIQPTYDLYIVKVILPTREDPGDVELIHKASYSNGGPLLREIASIIAAEQVDNILMAMNDEENRSLYYDVTRGNL